MCRRNLYSISYVEMASIDSVRQKMRSLVSFNIAMLQRTGGYLGPAKTNTKVLQARFYWPILFKDVRKYVITCDRCQKKGNISKWHEIPQSRILDAELFDVWGIDFIGLFHSSHNNLYILVAIDYVSEWVKAISTAINDSKVMIKFLKKHVFTSLAHQRLY